jgi:hypothetical protein
MLKNDVMKKITTIAMGLLILVSLNSRAQKGKEIILGVGGAFTTVWILNQNFYGEPEVDYAPKTGYAGSLNLGYNFTKNISALTELQYSLQGQKYDGDQNNQKTLRDIDLRYFNIPLFFKYAFGSGGTKFRFMAGPQIGFLLEANQEYTRDGNSFSYEVTKTNVQGESIKFRPGAGNITDRFKKNDFSLVLDIGADIHISDFFYINAGIRGNYGLTQINADSYRILNSDNEYPASTNLWGGIYVGINYKLDVQSYSQRSF